MKLNLDRFRRLLQYQRDWQKRLRMDRIAHGLCARSTTLYCLGGLFVLTSNL